MKYSNAQTVQQLEFLFSYSPPAELRQHLSAMFFHYLSGLATDAMPPDFKDSCDSMRLLLNFLESAEKHAQAEPDKP